MKAVPPGEYVEIEYAGLPVRAGLDAAREVGQWPGGLRALLHRWRLRATAYTDPGFDAAVQAARRARPEDLVPLPGGTTRSELPGRC